MPVLAIYSRDPSSTPFEGGTNATAVAGGILGAFVLIALVISLWACLRRGRSHQETPEQRVDHENQPRDRAAARMEREESHRQGIAPNALSRMQLPTTTEPAHQQAPHGSTLRYERPTNRAAARMEREEERRRPISVGALARTQSYSHVS